MKADNFLIVREIRLTEQKLTSTVYFMFLKEQKPDQEEKKNKQWENLHNQKSKSKTFAQ